MNFSGRWSAPGKWLKEQKGNKMEGVISYG
jgi:hypothetical protein